MAKLVSPPSRKPAPAKPAPAKPAPAKPGKALSSLGALPSAPPAAPGRKLPPAPAKPAPAATPAAGTPGAGTAILAALDALSKRIDALTTKREKAPPVNTRGQARTEAEILDGVKIAKGDWRKDWHGVTIPIASFRTGRNGDPETVEGAAVVDMLCALPRDADGAMAPDARAQGFLAVHYRQTEDGAWLGEPGYLTEAQLETLRRDG